MGKLAPEINNDLAELRAGRAHLTESPRGDRGEARPAVGEAQGRILLRLSRREHRALVQEAAAEGVSLNHYLTEIVCSRPRTALTGGVAPPRHRRDAAAATRKR